MCYSVTIVSCGQRTVNIKGPWTLIPPVLCPVRHWTWWVLNPLTGSAALWHISDPAGHDPQSWYTGLQLFCQMPEQRYTNSYKAVQLVQEVRRQNNITPSGWCQNETLWGDSRLQFIEIQVWGYQRPMMSTCEVSDLFCSYFQGDLEWLERCVHIKCIVIIMTEKRLIYGTDHPQSWCSHRPPMWYWWWRDRC